MSGFSSRRKPKKKKIGLNRVKDFLLLIIIMRSSEILTNLVYMRRHNLFSELENSKITRKPSLFLPRSSIYFFFDNALPLLFPREKWLLPCSDWALFCFLRPGGPPEVPLYNFRTAWCYGHQNYTQCIGLSWMNLVWYTLKPCICAGPSRTTKLNGYHLTYSQVEIDWDICKFNFLFLCC